MNDKDFLTWIYGRLVNVHGENELLDYMCKLRCIITDTPADKMTPNDGRGGNELTQLPDEYHGKI